MIPKFFLQTREIWHSLGHRLSRRLLAADYWGQPYVVMDSGWYSPDRYDKNEQRYMNQDQDDRWERQLSDEPQPDY